MARDRPLDRRSQCFDTFSFGRCRPAEMSVPRPAIALVAIGHRAEFARICDDLGFFSAGVRSERYAYAPFGQHRAVAFGDFSDGRVPPRTGCPIALLLLPFRSSPDYFPARNEYRTGHLRNGVRTGTFGRQQPTTPKIRRFSANSSRLRFFGRTGLPASLLIQSEIVLGKWTDASV